MADELHVIVDEKRRCVTCKWSTFHVTNHKPPRIHPHKHGTCSWPIPALKIALCITVNAFHRQAIWTQYEGCEVWEGRHA